MLRLSYIRKYLSSIFRNMPFNAELKDRISDLIQGDYLIIFDNPHLRFTCIQKISSLKSELSAGSF